MARKKSARKKVSKKTSKKSVKKTAKKSKKSQVKKSRDDPIMFLGVLVLFMIAVAVGAYMFTEPSVEETTYSGVLVTVNGFSITTDTLAFQYNLLPVAYRESMTEEQVLEQIINEELVVQAAVAEGIEITPEDVNTQIQTVISSGGLTLADLQQNLDSFNISMEDFETLIKKQLYIERYSKNHVFVPSPTDEDIRLLYEARKENFMVEEQVDVKHVLVSNQREDAAVLAKEVYEKVRAGDDFCELVSEYSDDKGSLDICGEYIFPRGMMVPEFEEAGFEMSDGEVRMIQSMFGYHIMLKVADVPARTKPLDEVRDALLAEYTSVERSRAYQIELSDLRDEANIVYAGEAEPEYVVKDNLEEEFQVEVVPMDDTVPMDELAVHVTTPDCVASKATLYGTEWSTDSVEERAAHPNIPYQACDMQPDECTSNDIVAYPTWVVNGEKVLGRLTYDELVSLSGC